MPTISTIDDVSNIRSIAAAVTANAGAIAIQNIAGVLKQVDDQGNVSSLGGGGGGVTSIVAGTGISISGATGAVTVTNTAPFGADTTIQINNVGGTPVSAWEGISTLTNTGAGTEASQYVIKLLTAGAQVSALTLAPAQLLATAGTNAKPGVAVTAARGLFSDATGLALASAGTNQDAVWVKPGSSGGLLVGADLGTLTFSAASQDVSIGRDSSGRCAITGSNGIIFANNNIGFFATAPVVKQTSGANLTNSVTSGGSNDVIADFTSLSVYATDAATIRNDIFQLARKLKQINDGLRAYGLFT